ncbi:hypothetical protein AYI69_g10144, partial [Smittium culicis]
MAKLNVLIYAISSLAAVASSLRTTVVYEPLYKNGINTIIRKLEIDLASYTNVHEDAKSSKLIYDSNSISATGWTEKNLDYIINRKFTDNEIICKNCDTNSTNEMDFIEITTFGKCIGGFCEYQNSKCYYNVLQKYWWKCIPDEFNENKNLIKKDNDKCDTSKSIVPFSVVSAGAKKYDFSKPITFPCNKDGFDMDIDVETEDDLYLMLTDKNSYSPSDSVIEISFNFKDKLYKFTEGVVSPASGSSQSPNSSRAFNGRIRIMYTGENLNIYINNEGEPFYAVKNKVFKALYFAPKSGKVDVTFGFMFCYGEAEFATISQQSEKCDTSKSIVPFSVVSAGAKKYDFSKPITFPCNKDGFDMDIDVETEDDLYLMLTDKNGYSPSDSVIEISFNFKDKLYKFTEGVVSPASGSSQSPNSSRAFNGRIRIMYTGENLNIYINNEGEPFYAVKNKVFKALYFAPKSGKVDVTFGFMFCYGEAEFATISQQSEKCDTSKSIVPFSVVSAGAKKYDFSKPITFPCNKDGFDMDIDVETEDDLYLMLTDKN